MLFYRVLVVGFDEVQFFENSVILSDCCDTSLMRNRLRIRVCAL